MRKRASKIIYCCCVYLEIGLAAALRRTALGSILVST
jgi:uncharacterized membrane protein